MNSDEPATRPVAIRPRAVEDIERHADYLPENAAPEIALRFRAAIMDAVAQIAFLPGSGAPRAVQNARLSGLRMYSVPGFHNYLVFYLTPKYGVEIVRVFHGAQDIRNILEDEE